MTAAAWVWLALAVVLGIVEGATAGLVSMWFAGGAIAAFIAALLGWFWPAQIVTFVVTSAILLACFRPLAKKRAVVNPVATNADRIIGRSAIVTEPIDNLKATGAVRVDGVDWTARSSGDTPIESGETVKILKISGVKVVVEPARQPVNA